LAATAAQPAENLGDLPGGYSLAKYYLREPLAQSQVVVQDGKAQVLVRQGAQSVLRLTNPHVPTLNILQQAAQFVLQQYPSAPLSSEMVLGP
jgi:hypothetical protein